MATRQGANNTKINITVPSEKLAPGDGDGRRRNDYDTYNLADLGTAFATGQTLAMGKKLPKGARVLDVMLRWDALGAGALLDLGWEASDSSANPEEAADSDGFSQTTPINAAVAGHYSFKTGTHHEAVIGQIQAVQTESPGFQKSFSAEVQPLVTSNVGGAAVTGKISLQIEYTRD
jgi:hypothetical protein